MTRRAFGVCAAVAALAAALALCACDVPAAGAPVLYADQEAKAAELVEASVDETAASEADDEIPADNFYPVESVGEGMVPLHLENHLGTTITSISIRPSGTDDWPEETSFSGLSIPNGSAFELRVDAEPGEHVDVRYEGNDGTTFMAVDGDLFALAMDGAPDETIRVRYDRGITFMEYTNRQGFHVDTRLSAQESLDAMRAQLEGRQTTFTFTERDMEGVEAGQETENCLD